MEHRDVIFVLDGGANAGEVCGLHTCFEPATGHYEIVDAETMEYLGTVALCRSHGEALGTGVPVQQT